MPDYVLVLTERARLREELLDRMPMGPEAPELLFATDGAHAMEIAKSRRPVVILADQEHEFIARRAASFVISQGQGAKVVILSADGKQMVTRTVEAAQPATWQRLLGAINGSAARAGGRSVTQPTGMSRRGAE